MEQLAHRLEWQAGLAPQPLTGPRRHLAPEAAELRELLFLLAEGGRRWRVSRKPTAATGRAQGGKPGEVMGGPPDAAPPLAVSTAPLSSRSGCARRGRQ